MVRPHGDTEHFPRDHVKSPCGGPHSDLPACVSLTKWVTRRSCFPTSWLVPRGMWRTGATGTSRPAGGCRDTISKKFLSPLFQCDHFEHSSIKILRVLAIKETQEKEKEKTIVDRSPCKILLRSSWKCWHGLSALNHKGKISFPLGVYPTTKQAESLPCTGSSWPLLHLYMHRSTWAGKKTILHRYCSSHPRHFTKIKVLLSAFRSHSFVSYLFPSLQPTNTDY